MTLKAVDKNLSLNSKHWTFSLEGLAQKFSSHIQKSLPCYREGHQLILNLSSFFVRSGSQVYDLGCSVGELTKELAKRYEGQPGTRVMGIDKEPEMIRYAKETSPEISNLHYSCQDFLSCDFQSSSFFIFYYTLQFLSLEERRKVLKKVSQSLNQDGACVVFEKVIEKTPWLESTTDFLHRQYKLEQGLSSEEIISKEASLKGVLTPLSQEENFQLFRDCGFSKVNLLMKNLHFEGYLLQK